MPPRSFWRSFFPWWLLFSVMGALWALATPIGASPDAPSQVARAVSVARGQWLGRPVPGPNRDTTTYVSVPATYLSPGLLAHCYMFKQNVTASCAPPARPSGRLARTTTHVGRYPPAYYLLVGWPSRFTDAVSGIYWLQAASALLCAAALASAVATARRWSSSAWLVPGVGVAATPMSLFLASQVNPSGLEVASAIAVWVPATVLSAEHFDRAPPGLLTVLTANAALLVWARPTALAWPFVIAAVLGPLFARRSGAAAWPRPWWCIGALVLSMGGAAAWAIFAKATAIGANLAPLPRSSALPHVVSFVVSRLPSLLQQGIGNFGWLDTPLPWPVVATWSALAVALVVAAGLSASKEAILTLALSAAACFIVPVGLLVAVAHRYGYVGQGRYFLAIWAGLPIVAAGVTVPARGHGRRRGRPVPPAGRTTVAATVGALQLFAFYWALRRYAVGTGGPVLWADHARGYGGQAQWHPPGGSWALLGLFASACLVYTVALSWGPGRGRYRGWASSPRDQGHRVKTDHYAALSGPPATPG